VVGLRLPEDEDPAPPKLTRAQSVKGKLKRSWTALSGA
jgi:cell volume regulation protein A